ncbi:hypothetical protein BB559_002414 [Furculomyces boomerangus]|uniref:Uncharacterized protein n=1 Tax=Furculomyces boomerangus TaxID=61424 RepID=A0A2T9YVJ3_9FUNG|nr:hypothetical protein BB559_005567 [Furculomyces boomerangus]PVU96358.1 hypothetical protein BB559_002414 [Furculomyces boomerangus]
MNRAIRQSKFIPTGIDNRIGYNLQKYTAQNESIVSKLQLTNVLRGHSGCVNSITFSKDGTLLISASDDSNLCLWDVENNYKLICTLITGHSANIFSVKLIEEPINTKIVTSGLDGKIKIFSLKKLFTSLSKNLPRGNSFYYVNRLVSVTSPVVLAKDCMELNYKCHSGSVKRIATVPNSPYEFLTCSEDGTVREFDTRVNHTCGSLTNREILVQNKCKKNILVDYSKYGFELYSISINRYHPHYFAIGGTTDCIFMHDRRMAKLDNRFPPMFLRTSCVARFKPNDLDSTNASQPNSLSQLCNISTTQRHNMMQNSSSDDSEFNSNVQPNTFFAQNTGLGIHNRSSQSSLNTLSNDYINDSESIHLHNEILLESRFRSTSRRRRYIQSLDSTMYVTATKFSRSNGHELLGSWSGKYVYLFDIRKSSAFSTSQSFVNLYKKNRNDIFFSQNTDKPVRNKRLQSGDIDFFKSKKRYSKKGYYISYFNSTDQTYSFSNICSEGNLSFFGNDDNNFKPHFKMSLGFESIYKNMNQAAESFRNHNYLHAIQLASSSLAEIPKETPQLNSPTTSNHNIFSDPQSLTGRKASKKAMLRSVLFGNIAAGYLAQCNEVWVSTWVLLFGSKETPWSTGIPITLNSIRPIIAVENQSYEDFLFRKEEITQNLNSLESLISMAQANIRNALFYDRNNKLAICNSITVSFFTAFHKTFSEFFNLKNVLMTVHHDQPAVGLRVESEYGSSSVRILKFLNETLKNIMESKQIISSLEKAISSFENNRRYCEILSLVGILANKIIAKINSVKSIIQSDENTSRYSRIVSSDDCYTYYLGLVNVFYLTEYKEYFKKNGNNSRKPEIDKDKIELPIYPLSDIGNVIGLLLLSEFSGWKILRSKFNSKYFEYEVVTSLIEDDSVDDERNKPSTSKAPLSNSNKQSYTTLPDFKSETNNSQISNDIYNNPNNIERTDELPRMNLCSHLSENASSSSTSSSQSQLTRNLRASSSESTANNNSEERRKDFGFTDPNNEDSQSSTRCESNVKITSYVSKYTGHCNVNTVKDINFFGPYSEFIVSGSDDGNMFIWRKSDSKLVQLLKCNSEVVNVIQPFRGSPIIAVSGIDDEVYIYTPSASPIKPYNERYPNIPEATLKLWDGYVDKLFELYTKNIPKSLDEKNTFNFVPPSLMKNGSKHYSAYTFNNPLILSRSKSDNLFTDKKAGYLDISPESVFSELGFPITSQSLISRSNEIESFNELDRVHGLESRLTTRRIYRALLFASLELP